jgi:hypothetical protein
MAETATATPAASTTSSATPSTTSVGTQSSTATATPQTQSYDMGGKSYGSFDDARKAYESLQKDHGQWTQKYGDLEKNYKQYENQLGQWTNWWKTIEPLWGQDVEGLLQQKLTRGRQPQGQQYQQPQQQPQQQMQRNPYEGYDMLTPAEQFTKFKESYTGELAQALNQRLAGMQEQYNQQLAQKEQWYQQYLSNHFSLLRRALEQKFTDPNFNIDAVMEQAANAIAGKMDPIDLGKQLIAASSYPEQLEKIRKEAYELGKKDQETAATNKAMETVTPGSASAPAFKMPVNTNPKRGFASLRESAGQAVVKKFGPQIFSE